MRARLAASVVLALAAWVAPAAARTHPAVRVSIPLPGPAGSEVELLTVHVTASAGHVAGAPSVKSPNGANLPAGIRSVAAIEPPSSSRRGATFRIYVLVNNLAGRSAAHAAAEQPTLTEQLTASGSSWAKDSFTESVLTGDCASLVPLGDLADTQAPHPPVDEVSLEPETVQPSAPEAVLDNVIRDECAQAEVPEPGPR